MPFGRLTWEFSERTTSVNFLDLTLTLEHQPHANIGTPTHYNASIREKNAQPIPVYPTALGTPTGNLKQNDYWLHYSSFSPHIYQHRP
jgi:hypothetical protein